MKAAILAIGTEITRGELVNTNAQWLSEQLTGGGFSVVEQVVVADDAQQIEGTLQRLAKTVQVLLTTGGLGPTSDDMTSACVARTLDVPLQRHPETLQRIRDRWLRLGKTMPESNCKQADFPEGATIVPNARGTAPGFVFKLGEMQGVCLPGVPGEMKPMVLQHVMPMLQRQIDVRSYQVHLRSFGLAESQVADLLRELEAQNPDVAFGYRAHFPEIEIKLLAQGDSINDAEAKARKVAEQVREILGAAVFGERKDRFAAHVGTFLRDRGLRVAVAESCTGGLVGQMLTSMPGSSNYLVADAVVYDNAAKTRMLGVSPELLRAHGAVSAESAQAMAEGILKVVDADVALAVTGIAGPGGGSDAKPVGTVWFALASAGDHPVQVQHHRLHGDRERVRTLSAYMLLAQLMDYVRDHDLRGGA